MREITEIKRKVSELPSGIRPRLEYLDRYAFARTRRDLLYYLWYVVGIKDVNVAKEGALYACQIGNTIHATGIRALHTTSVQGWEESINKAFFPASIH